MKTHSTISTFHLVAVRACKSTSNSFNLIFIHRLSAASTCAVFVRLKISLFMEMKSNVFSVHESSNDYLIKRLYVRKVCCIQIKKMPSSSLTTAMEVFAPMIPLENAIKRNNVCICAAIKRYSDWRQKHRKIHTLETKEKTYFYQKELQF